MAVKIKTSSRIIVTNNRMTDTLIHSGIILVLVLVLSNHLLLNVKCQDYEDLNTNNDNNNNNNKSISTSNNNNNKPVQPQFGRAPSGGQQAPSANQEKQTDKTERVANGGAPDEANSSEPNDADQQNNGTSSSARPHETVYSDQRFASLFARRNQGKKLRPPPSEPIKAKPTLPSFIKSPPDLAKFQQTTPQPSSLQSNSALASQRLQQQQRQQSSLNNQRNLNSQLSNGANNRSNNLRAANPVNNANNNNNLKNKQNNNNNLANARAQTSSPTPAIKPLANKFPANGNSDNPTNLIALARKRFLANSALQNSAAAKAKPPAQSTANVQAT